PASPPDSCVPHPGADVGRGWAHRPPSWRATSFSIHHYRDARATRKVLFPRDSRRSPARDCGQIVTCDCRCDVAGEALAHHDGGPRTRLADETNTSLQRPAPQNVAGVRARSGRNVRTVGISTTSFSGEPHYPITLHPEA